MRCDCTGGHPSPEESGHGGEIVRVSGGARAGAGGGGGAGTGRGAGRGGRREHERPVTASATGRPCERPEPQRALGGCVGRACQARVGAFSSPREAPQRSSWGHAACSPTARQGKASTDRFEFSTPLGRPRLEGMRKRGSTNHARFSLQGACQDRAGGLPRGIRGIGDHPMPESVFHRATYRAPGPPGAGRPESRILSNDAVCLSLKQDKGAAGAVFSDCNSPVWVPPESQVCPVIPGSYALSAVPSPPLSIAVVAPSEPSVYSPPARLGAALQPVAPAGPFTTRVVEDSSRIRENSKERDE